ncbi:MAG: glycerol-3-phosphate 1-O-acyltransferase PlsY [Prolixibacteraceae bacterium]
MMSFLEIGCLVLTYLLGSIPFGYILTKAKTGKNILEAGSGNVGSTNVRRVAGKKIALYTQLLDMFKGLLPVALFLYFTKFQGMETPGYFFYALALAAILGHNFSIFLKFKGGKGVNTTLGASLLLAPYSVFSAVLVYYVIKWRFKFVSLGSLCLGLTLPLVELILHRFSSTFYYLLICSLLIFLMHWKNILRLLQGNELH